MATTTKSNPNDRPVWITWYGKDGIHGFMGKSNNQIKEEDRKFKETKSDKYNKENP